MSEAFPSALVFLALKCPGSLTPSTFVRGARARIVWGPLARNGVTGVAIIGFVSGWPFNQTVVIKNLALLPCAYRDNERDASLLFECNVKWPPIAPSVGPIDSMGGWRCDRDILLWIPCQLELSFFNILGGAPQGHKGIRAPRSPPLRLNEPARFINGLTPLLLGRRKRKRKRCPAWEHRNGLSEPRATTATRPRSNVLQRLQDASGAWPSTRSASTAHRVDRDELQQPTKNTSRPLHGAAPRNRRATRPR
jgi:hypothetical protein